MSSGYGTLTLNGGLTTNAFSTLFYSLSSSSIGSSPVNSDPIYGGDLLNLGSSNLTVGGGTIAFKVDLNPNAMGDYRLFAGSVGSTFGNPVLSNFTLPTLSGTAGYSAVLSTTVDPTTSTWSSACPW